MTIIKFHSEAEKAFNKKAYEFVELIEELKVANITPLPLKGSMAKRVPVKLSSPLPNGPVTGSLLNVKNERVDTFEENNKKRIGFNQATHEKFTAFLGQIYKLQEISQKISYNFLFHTSFSWVLDTYKSKQSKGDYCPFLIESIQGKLSDYTYRYEIVNLDIHRNFKVGNVQIEFIEPEFFDGETKEENKEQHTWLVNRYSGRVYTSFLVKQVEEEKGEEIALIECCKAVNVLKLFTTTVMVPTYETDFDLDVRVPVTTHSETIVKNLSKQKGLMLRYKRRASDHLIDDQAIDCITHEANLFSKLLTKSAPSELEKLVLNGINKFSTAISNHDIHKRIVELFTIWESLLLKGQSSPIRDSIRTFGPALLKNGKNQREEFSKFLDRMYDIRSEIIHHAIERPLDMNEVAILQLETVQLMSIMLDIGHKHQTKITLLEELEANK